MKSVYSRTTKVFEAWGDRRVIAGLRLLHKMNPYRQVLDPKWITFVETREIINSTDFGTSDYESEYAPKSQVAFMGQF